MIASPATWHWLLPSLALLAASLALCGLFCGLETGLYVLNKVRLDLRAEAGSRRAKSLQRMLANPGNLLAVLLIGTNIAAYVFTSAVAAMFAHADVGRRAAEWYTELVATLLLFILGDSVPKNVFRRLAERLMYRLSWFLAGANVVLNVTGLAPLVRAMAWLATRRLRPDETARSIAKERMAAIFAEGSASGAMTHIQWVMADRVMHLARRTLADAMVPIEKAVTVHRDIGHDELIGLARRVNFSRLPVRDAAGAVIGVLDIYDVLAAERPPALEKLIAPPLVLPADGSITQALYHMQRRHTMLAVVQSPDGRPLGIVTIKDLVEEIVGELEEW